MKKNQDDIQPSIAEQDNAAPIGIEEMSESAQLSTLKQMLDSMPVNVMTCELENFTINYVNKTSIETLGPLEHLLPCKADELLGQCVDIFHKNPAHQRKLLSDDKNLPWQANIQLGEEVLELLVTAIYDEAGNYSAACLVWSVITEKIKADADTKRLTMMVDNMPINVMMADPKDFTITYANKTSVDTLRTLQDHLPCKADELVGQCIDIFHKHPDHQRALLGDPSNLPHVAQIKVGPETLRLNVSAINDADGSYIGPMVAWSVISQQLLFGTEVDTVVQTVSSASNEMRNLTTSISEKIEQASQQSSTVAAAAEEATSNVQTVAAAAEELSSSVDEVGRQVQQSANIASGAVDEARKTNDQVESLAEAAQKIGDVVDLINDIASQTNLLALNATIEAARAGEAGKGFAVVATEVKSLADQTAKATDEISGQIGEIQTATGDAVGAIKGIGETISEISEIASAISAAVEEQGAATREIAQNVDQAAQGTSEVSQTITQIATVIADTGSATGDMKSSADTLATEADTLGSKVKDYMETV